jgi:hypothetical protein
MEHVGELLRRFWSSPEHKRELRLAAMWKNWPEIVGADVAKLAKPLGRSKTTLLLGVEDAIAMQEVSFYAQHILRTVNASLGDFFFDKVRLDLIGTRTSLDAVTGTAPSCCGSRYGVVSSPLTVAGVMPDKLGKVHGFCGMPTLERCYRAYVRLFDQLKDNSKK